MKIERPIYMQQLIDSKDNGLIKIVTGLRRVGKSYLLKILFKEYLVNVYKIPICLWGERRHSDRG